MTKEKFFDNPKNINYFYLLFLLQIICLYVGKQIDNSNVTDFSTSAWMVIFVAHIFWVVIWASEGKKRKQSSRYGKFILFFYLIGLLVGFGACTANFIILFS